MSKTISYSNLEVKFQSTVFECVFSRKIFLKNENGFFCKGIVGTAHKKLKCEPRGVQKHLPQNRKLDKETKRNWGGFSRVRNSAFSNRYAFHVQSKSLRSLCPRKTGTRWIRRRNDREYDSSWVGKNAEKVYDPQREKVRGDEFGTGYETEFDSRRFIENERRNFTHNYSDKGTTRCKVGEIERSNRHVVKNKRKNHFLNTRTNWAKKHFFCPITPRPFRHPRAARAPRSCTRDLFCTKKIWGECRYIHADGFDFGYITG